MQRTYSLTLWAFSLLYIITYERVDRFEASLHRFVHRLSWDNTWRFQLNSLAHIAVDRSLSVDSVSEGIDDSSENTLSNGHINNCSCSFHDISFLDISAHNKWRQVRSIRTVSLRHMAATLTYLSLPRMTIPTLSVSRLRAIPMIPDLNSTISPAWTLVRPNTLAIPSPMEMTDPNSFKSFCTISWLETSLRRVNENGDLLI